MIFRRFLHQYAGCEIPSAQATGRKTEWPQCLYFPIDGQARTCVKNHCRLEQRVKWILLSSIMRSSSDKHTWRLENRNSPTTAQSLAFLQVNLCHSFPQPLLPWNLPFFSFPDSWEYLKFISLLLQDMLSHSVNQFDNLLSNYKLDPKCLQRTMVKDLVLSWALLGSCGNFKREVLGHWGHAFKRIWDHSLFVLFYCSLWSMAPHMTPTIIYWLFGDTKATGTSVHGLNPPKPFHFITWLFRGLVTVMKNWLTQAPSNHYTMVYVLVQEDQVLILWPMELLTRGGCHLKQPRENK